MTSKKGYVEELKKIKEIKYPEWAKFIKTSAGKERPPLDDDWWFERTYSILNKIRKNAPIGVNRLSKYYGARKNKGHKREHKYKGSKKIIRVIIQQLREANLVKNSEGTKKGNVLTEEGKKFLKRFD